MADDLRKLLSRVIKEAENEGEFKAESAAFRPLRDRVRGSDDESRGVATLLMSFISFNSSLTRLCSMQLVDYFFMRSKSFRSVVSQKLSEMLILTAETDALHSPLPPPKEDAEKLKVFTIGAFTRWEEKFGAGNVALRSAISNLKSTKTLDFTRVSSEMEAERRRREEKEAREKRKTEKICSRVESSFSVLHSEMVRTMEEARALAAILVPSFTVDEGGGKGEEGEGEVDPALHGYSNGESFTLTIPASALQIPIDSSNIDVVRSAIDAQKMLAAHGKKLEGWLRDLGGHTTGTLLRDLLTLKKCLQYEHDKLAELRLALPEEKRRRERREEGDSSTDDDDLEDVPEKELEDFVAPDEVPAHILEAVKRDNERGKEEKKEEKEEEEPLPGPSSSVPRLSYGLDLLYWGQEKKEVAQVPMNDADCHRFWRPPDEGETRTEREDVYSTRVFTFVGEEKRSERACRAPLSSGRLCPRMDRQRCPIHGVIVERDGEGFPLEEMKEGEKREEREKMDDEEYMRDLEDGLGRSLQGEGKKKRKKEKSPVTNDGRAVRERLESKLLNPRTIKRVSEALEEVRRAKIRKKFGHQTSHRHL